MKRLIIIPILLVLSNCGSAPVVPSTDTCTVKKHVQDDVYQVLINDKPVNNRWYMKADANEIKLLLGVRNKCKR